MKESAGRLVFFDAVAEMLLHMRPGSVPKAVALRASTTEIGINDDCIGVAQAIARHCAESVQEVPVRSVEDLNVPAGVDALVVLALGHPTEAVLGKLKSCELDRLVVVIVGYSKNDAQVIIELKYDPELDRVLIEEAVRRVFNEVGAVYDPFASERVVTHGISCLASDFHLFEKASTPNWDDSPSSIARLCYSLSRTWIYEGNPVSSDRVAAWAEQFRDAGFMREACELLAYLRNEGFVTKRFIDGALGRLYYHLSESELGKVRYVSMQPAGKSEPMLAYAFRSVATPTPIVDALAKLDGKPCTFVCIDDVIISGGTVLRYLFEQDAKIGRKLTDALGDSDLRIVILVSHADERGIEEIEADERCRGAVSVRAASIVDDRVRVFHPDSTIFYDRSRVASFESFCREIGEHLNPSNPLGWDNAQWCVVLDYSVPNGTLPILWASRAGFQWQPLFPRTRQPKARPRAGQ